MKEQDTHRTANCPRCEGRRMVTTGHLSDERPYWRVCQKCGGHGEVAKPDCYEPIEGLKHNVVAVLDAIGACLTAGNKLVTAPITTPAEREIESLHQRIMRLENLPVEEAMTMGNTLTLAALKARMAVLEDQAGDATSHDVN